MFHDLSRMIFFDTEFIEYPGTLELISIGMITGDGKQMYHGVHDFDKRIFDKAPSKQWLTENVMPYLKDERRKKTDALRAEVKAFIDSYTDQPIFAGRYCDYDWVAFCWLFGPMVDLPDNWPKHAYDLKQFEIDHNVPGDLRPVNERPHHALWDAMQDRQHLKAMHNWLCEPRESDRKYHIEDLLDITHPRGKQYDK